MSARQSNLRQVAEGREFHVESWCSALGVHTFPTEFVPVSSDDAQRLLDQCLAYRTGSSSKVSQWEAAGLQPLFEALTLAMKALNADANGAFVRLSTRSPKDAALLRPSLWGLFQEQRTQVKKMYGSDLESTIGRDAVDKLAFTRAAGRSLCVHTADEALKLFVASQRVLEDLQESLSATAKGATSDLTSIVVRKWVDLPSEFEFRCFVVDGKLTAISQYFAKTYVPALFENKAVLERAMRDFFDSTKDLLSISTYIVDYAVEWVPETKQVGKIWIVEINNPPPVAGTAMFSKKNEHDLDVMWGRAPFEFRVLEAVPEDPMKNHRLWMEQAQRRAAPKTADKSRSFLRTSL